MKVVSFKLVYREPSSSIILELRIAVFIKNIIFIYVCIKRNNYGFIDNGGVGCHTDFLNLLSLCMQSAMNILSLQKRLCYVTSIEHTI